ncbi:MAG: hypothetical protein BGO69_13795 [Bacteroidetes bacterium 46-16]|nr:MAG: hypothetical protein BGO69_13795 [Bacteroidetes bacterium 46-16]
MSLSIILPCYNPPEGWAENILANYKVLRQKIEGPIELIVVNDGGRDKGIRKADITYLEEQIKELKFIGYDTNMGKGHAVRYGMERANGELLMYTDIDFPYDTTSFISIYQALKSGRCDVAAGIKNKNYYDKVPFVRRQISKYLRFLIRIFLSMPISDTQCGLKGFTQKVKPLFLQTTIDRYIFDLEFIRNCFKNNLKVEAIPVQLNEDVHFRKMNPKILTSEIINFIKLLLK